LFLNLYKPRFKKTNLEEETKMEIKKEARQKLKMKGYKIATEKEADIFFTLLIKAPEEKKEVIEEIKKIKIELDIPPTEYLVPLNF